MIFRLAFLSLLVVLGSAVASPSGHYVPQVGDSFHYSEVVSLTNGSGSYQGYTETTAYVGNESVSAVAANGTVSAYYADSWRYENNSGGSLTGHSSGPFTFSDVTFHYLHGTDGQVGYTNPYVWFYMNNSLQVGAGFYLLNTAMKVVSRAYDYDLGTAAGAYVMTIFAEGNGSYQRNDSYGVLSAQYNWKEYFDPATGFVVGYTYVEQDSNATAAFTWTDTLGVTSTTYPLTAGSAPATGSSSSGSSFPWTLVVGAVVVLVIVVAIVVWALRSRRRHPLPPHSARGQVQYTAPLAPPPLGPPPPPISLTPSGEPAVQQIIVKETVKVNCRYCGSLIDSTAEKCPFCGATRT